MATTTRHSFVKTRDAGHYRDIAQNQLADEVDAAVPVDGTATFSGDGVNTTFQIAHGLDSAPSTAQVTAASDGAAGDFYVSGIDGTNITVEYASAPGNGTDNIVLYYAAY